MGRGRRTPEPAQRTRYRRPRFPVLPAAQALGSGHPAALVRQVRSSGLRPKDYMFAFSPVSEYLIDLRSCTPRAFTSVCTFNCH